jgi:HK97 gp10 family phage protein
MPDFEFKLEGFSELMEQLDVFCSPKVQVKLVQNSVKEAAKPVKAAAERNLGRGKGYIAVGVPKRRGWGAGAIAAIGIGIAKKHWQLVFTEYGTIERVKGHRRGKITAHPFIRPALDSKKSEAIDRMGKYLELCLSAIFTRRGRDAPDVMDIPDTEEM